MSSLAKVPMQQREVMMHIALTYDYYHINKNTWAGVESLIPPGMLFGTHQSAQ